MHQIELYFIFCKRDKECLNTLLHCGSLRMKALKGTKAIFDFGSGGDGAYLQFYSIFAYVHYRNNLKTCLTGDQWVFREITRLKF